MASGLNWTGTVVPFAVVTCEIMAAALRECRPRCAQWLGKSQSRGLQLWLCQAKWSGIEGMHCCGGLVWQQLLGGCTEPPAQTQAAVLLRGLTA